MTIFVKTRLESSDYRELRYRVTPFKSAGIYPRGTFANETGLFHADDDVVFAVTFCATWRAQEDLPYSEVNWMHPVLVRMLGSLMFCEQFAEGKRCWFYPVMHSDLILSNDSLDLCDTDVFNGLRNIVVKESAFSSPSVQSEKDESSHKSGYLFEPKGELDILMRERYWKCIQPSNRLVMRGIHALIKCDMLALHPEFQEEAAISSFIALDAAYELVRRHLIQLGVANPSSSDAAAWFHNTFDGPMGLPEPDGQGFFADFYPQRIQTLHPGSRYGDAPFAAIAIDDRIHLRQALPGLFAYLISGEYSPHYAKNLAKHRAATTTSSSS